MKNDLNESEFLLYEISSGWWSYLFRYITLPDIVQEALSAYYAAKANRKYARYREYKNRSRP